MCVGVVVSSSSGASQPRAAVFSVFWIVDFITDTVTVTFVAKRFACSGDFMTDLSSSHQPSLSLNSEPHTNTLIHPGLYHNPA